MKKSNFKMFKKKILVTSLSTVLSFSLISFTTNASDLQIYQNPSASNNPILMLAIDNSSSMSLTDAKYQDKTVTRMNALKNSLVDALKQKDSEGNYRIPANVYMGISVFGTPSDIGTSSDWDKGSQTARASKILVEAKQLDETHRANLIKAVGDLGSNSSTPTPLLLSETYAYLLGNRTDAPKDLSELDKLLTASKYTNYTRGLSGRTLAPASTVDSATGKYIAPLTKLSNADAQCSTQGVFFLTDGAPVGIQPAVAKPFIRNALADQTFECDDSPLEDIYYDYLTSKKGAAQTFTGEFKRMANKAYLDSKFGLAPDYVGNAASSTQATWQNRSSWACVGKMVQKLSNQTQLTSSAASKRIYTSTVGFGPLFKMHTRETCTDINKDGLYDFCTFDDTYNDGGTGVDVSNELNAQALRMLGNRIGKGDTYNTNREIGGYTEATSGEDIQRALESFLAAVSAGNFESTSFGNYIVPADMLLRGKPYNYVFAPQFQPKISSVNTVVSSTHKLWLGNLKKYAVNNQAIMVDRLNRQVLDAAGNIKSDTRDFWNALNSNDGSSATKGGALSQLDIPKSLNLNDLTKVKTRPLYINATIPTTGDKKNQVVESNNEGLLKLTTQNVFNATYLDASATGWKKNKYQPYLLSALGYKLTQSYLNGLENNYQWDSLAKVSNLALMQQVGGVLHSDPILVTLEAAYDETTGLVKENTSTNKSNRKDYIVFGSMQGLLHMVDQESGAEEFAFLPNEILQDVDRKKALLEQENTLESSTHPYYGIDAPWIADVQYSINTTDKKFVADKANIYGGMRMGGRSYYGLNIKDPSSPKMLFQINPSAGKVISSTKNVSSTSAVEAISAMGQSWSKPTIAKVRFGNSIKNVMIVGGGYDSAYEVATYKPSTLASGIANEGAGVYIFDADTGALLWNARFGKNNNVTSTDVLNDQLRYSVVSQIKAFDRNTDGLVDNLYFGDLGGQVWRVDLNNALNTETTHFGRIHRLADFSAFNQRFYEMPALTVHDNAGQRFGAISIASGNRSFPLDTSNGADHRIYVLHDYDLGSRDLFSSTYSHTKDLTESNLLNWTAITEKTISDLTGAKNKGWYYILRKTGTKDEDLNTGTVKALNGYIAVANSNIFSDLYVSLYNPNDSSTQQPNACSGGINGSSRTLKLCLPNGICGDSSLTSDVKEKKKDNYSTTKTDGITKINISPITDTDGKIKTTLLGGGATKYVSTKVFKSYNWFERE